MKVLTFAYTYFTGFALLLAMAVFAPMAYSQPAPECEWNDCSGPQVGPGPCTPGWVCPLTPVKPPISGLPLGPEKVCLGASGCFPVRYSLFGWFMIAESVLPNGYPMMGWAGPCIFDEEVCPDIGNQAYTDLRLNALGVHRALRFEGL